MQIIPNKSKRARKRLIIESIAIFFIIASPFIYKLHAYLSQDPDATISVLGYVVDNNGFRNLSTYAWFLISKIIPIYLLAIWFFTCKHWWYHIILIPLCMYAFQLFEVVYTKDDYVDTENIFWLLPVCMIVITFVYFIRVKLYDKYVHGIDLEAMDAELQSYREKERMKQEKIKSYSSNDGEENVDLSEEASNRTFSKLFHQFQHSLKNLFNFNL